MEERFLVTRKRVHLLLTATAAIGALLAFAGTSTASPTGGGIAVGAVEYQGFGTTNIALVAQGTPASAHGWLVYRRAAPGFDANSVGQVTCYAQVGNRGYFSGVFVVPFLSGPTLIRFFNGVVVDASADGSADQAFIALGADAPIPCDEPFMTVFLDAVAATITRGNVLVH
jgi:hypothetical protein